MNGIENSPEENGPEENIPQEAPKEVDPPKPEGARKVPNSLPSTLRKYRKVILIGLGAITAGIIVDIVVRQQMHLSLLDSVTDIQGDVIDTLVDVALDTAVDAK